MRKFLFALLPLAIAGCAVGPDYEAPDTGAPETFANALPQAADDSHGEQRFWQGFDDPQLATLVQQTLLANHDLQAALARYEGAEALLRGARREQWPSITASAGAAEQHLAAVERTSSAERVEVYQAGVAARWELDLFGRLRRATESRVAELDAAGADLAALQVALVGQLASGYFELRGLQQQYLIAEQNVANQQALLDIVSSRVEAGRGTAFDQVRAQAQLDTTRAALPAIDSAVQVTLHRLAVLTGQPPAALRDTLGVPAPLPDALPSVPVGSPGDALRRRPDIRAAERRLAAARASASPPPTCSRASAWTG
ncbi:NodT family RND efflux system outer membrane lipoprotein [Alcanivorax sp. S71-1-4]|uniref:TolC family protein n=1 Tax=Alcanivorax sp. S71-1-4 TaxID=1177159 RepID=UPI0016B99AFE|nr:TolC family protein [Alcanivorax sp. S71-1-4]KAF0805959.1 NodT family RND efflux system outer membrane lipoprotein [Alcanivorax sp. S71-1-4]